MKTVLFIHSFQGANDRVKWLWPYYKHSGLDIFGVGRTNTKCEWPEPIPTKDIGEDAYISGANLPLRLVQTFEWFINDPLFKDYTHAMVIEWDSIFLGRPPEIEVKIAGTMSGMWPDASCVGGGHPFFHCPWWMSRDCAEWFVKAGADALEKRILGCGSPDLFIGKVCHDNQMPVFKLEGTFSKNSLDIPAHQELARSLIRENAVWFVHGIKSREQLNSILPPQ